MLRKIGILGILFAGIASASHVQETNDGSSRLFREIRAGNYAEVIEIIRQHPNILDAQDDDVEKSSPLHVAAEAGQQMILDYLVSIPGIDVDRRTPTSGFTPLHIASSSSAPGSFDTLKLLVRKHADINAQSVGGSTPLHLAVRYSGDSEKIKFLLNQEGINTHCKVLTV